MPVSGVKTELHIIRVCVSIYRLSFVRGRYGYVLRLAQQGELIESRVNEPEEFCVERVGRHQLSNGKDSLLGMNLSPIKRR